MDDQFYKKEYFEQLRLDMLEMKKDIKELNRKMTYIYGFAAAIGVVSSFIIQWIKSKIS